MTNLVEYKLITEEHASVGNKFTNRVVASLLDDKIDITGYAVREYPYSTEERIELRLPDNGSLLIVYTKNKS